MEQYFSFLRETSSESDVLCKHLLALAGSIAGSDSAEHDHSTAPSTAKHAGKTKAPFSHKAEELKEVSTNTVLTQTHRYQSQEQSCPCVFQIKQLQVVPR